MRKLSRWILVALAAVTLAGSAAQALTYTVTSISAGGGSACIDVTCSGGAVLTLSPTPQGSLGSGSATNTIDVTVTSITSIDVQLTGPLAFTPSGSVAGVHLNPSLFPAQFMTSSSCVTVGSTAFCGATFRFDSTILGSGTNHIFLTVNLTATAVPEPSVAALLAAGALFAVARRPGRRS